MEKNKIKVLYIAGSGRSGSTILHNILGQIEGFSAFGELRYIWDRGVVKNKLCGCGQEFHQCEFWQKVFETAYGGFEQINAKEMYRLTESFRIQNLPGTLIPNIRQNELTRLQAYLINLEKLYQTIHLTTGHNTIIDSSKNPSYGYLLRFIPSIDLHVLHFTRDPRAVAYSWTKVKEFQPGDYMARKDPLESALQWNARNLMSELFLEKKSGRHLFLRYEDFIENPQEAVKSIVSLMGENAVKLPFTASHTVDLTRINHSVFGNSVRFQTGPVTLKLDNKWKIKLNQHHKIAVGSLTLPLGLKYGYIP
jgi:hypothetical protein